MAIDSLRVAGVLPESVTDGPGIRYVVFAQGCPHHCEGCHNPETHDPLGGHEMLFSDIVSVIVKNPLLKGVTFSGGEPFLQAEKLLALLHEIKSAAKALHFWIYSGYTFEELMLLSKTNAFVLPLLSLCDVLVDGRFEKDKRSLALTFCGSKNQRLIDLKKTLEDGHIHLFSL